jgi:hypothetical protein
MEGHKFYGTPFIVSLSDSDGIADIRCLHTILKFTEWGDYQLIDLNTHYRCILTVELHSAVGTVFTTMNFNMAALPRGPYLQLYRRTKNEKHKLPNATAILKHIVFNLL